MPAGHIAQVAAAGLLAALLSGCAGAPGAYGGHASPYYGPSYGPVYEEPYPFGSSYLYGPSYYGHRHYRHRHDDDFRRRRFDRPRDDGRDANEDIRRYYDNDFLRQRLEDEDFRRRLEEDEDLRGWVKRRLEED